MKESNNVADSDGGQGPLILSRHSVNAKNSRLARGQNTPLIQPVSSHGAVNNPVRPGGRKNNRMSVSRGLTGMTMTLTAIAAVAVALFFVYRFETALNQIFIILLIGLSLDILNTWVTNTSLIKWFVEAKNKQNENNI